MTSKTRIAKGPVLSDTEKAELLASLEEAERRIAFGEAVEYDPKTFKKRLLEIYRAAKR